ncbi:MAG: hypothetical protein CMJ78_09670 [Planctomycetaceae bacterium]|nr:hypothetical protein [Planctomycetaceae bacterium]
MTDAQATLEVYEAGKTTVVGFGGRQLLDQINIVACRAELVELVKQHESEIMGFDLEGVKLVPSGLLGLLASLRDLGVSVEIYNPSEDVSEILDITKLNQVITVKEVDFDYKK